MAALELTHEALVLSVFVIAHLIFFYISQANRTSLFVAQTTLVFRLLFRLQLGLVIDFLGLQNILFRQSLFVGPLSLSYFLV